MIHLKFSIYTQQPLFRGVGGDTPNYVKKYCELPKLHVPNC